MYLEIDEGFPGHRKTLRLCSLMRDPLAGWYMVSLWTWACRSCKDGVLAGMGPYEIEEAAKYHKHDGKLCAAMIDAGFIDKDTDGNPREIHDWMKHTGGAIKRMDEGADRKKLYRLHRDGKCDGQSCQWCRTVPGQSQDSPNTKPVQIPGQTEDKPTPTRQDKTRQDQTRPERDSGARAGDPAELVPSTATPRNEHGKPTARNVLALFSKIRGETCGGKALFFQPTETTVEKAAKWLVDMPEDGVSDIEPAFKRACEGVRDGVKGWTDSRMSDPMFLFATIISRWSGLREEINGCAPKVSDRKPERQQFDHGMDLVVR